MNNQTQWMLEIKEQERFASQGDSNASIRTFIDLMKNGKIQIPKHQRDKVWDINKKKEFIENLLDKRFLMVGCIVTYQVVDKDGNASVKYLNDGYQRLSCILELVGNPEMYNKSKQEVDANLDNINISLQHRHYKNHYEAAKQFQWLNQGTAMLPHDYNKLHLVYNEKYELLKDSMNKLERCFNECDIRITNIGKMIKAEETKKKCIRDMYGTLTRFLSKEYITKNEYFKTISNSRVNLKNKKSVEEYFSKVISDMSINDIQENMNKLENMIYNITAVLEYCIEIANDRIDENNKDKSKMKKNKINLLSVRLFRFILSGFVYLYDSLKVNKEIAKNIMTEILFVTEGRNCNFVIIDNEKYMLYISFQENVSFASFIKKLKFNLGNDTMIRKKRDTSHIRKGYDLSHPINKPFSKFGECENSEIFIEPSSLNRSRKDN